MKWAELQLKHSMPDLEPIQIRLRCGPFHAWHSATFLHQAQIEHLSGLAAAVTALITWWACNAFVPLLGGNAGQRVRRAERDHG